MTKSEIKLRLQDIEFLCDSTIEEIPDNLNEVIGKASEIRFSLRQCGGFSKKELDSVMQQIARIKCKLYRDYNEKIEKGDQPFDVIAAVYSPALDFICSMEQLLLHSKCRDMV